jgi:hypothetical protein
MASVGQSLARSAAPSGFIQRPSNLATLSLDARRAALGSMSYRPDDRLSISLSSRRSQSLYPRQGGLSMPSRCPSRSSPQLRPPRAPCRLPPLERAAGCHGSRGEKLSAIPRFRRPACQKTDRQTLLLRSLRIASMNITGVDFLVPTVALLVLFPVRAAIWLVMERRS